MPTQNFIITEAQKTKLFELARFTGKSASFLIRESIDRMPSVAEIQQQKLAERYNVINVDEVEDEFNLEVPSDPA